MKFEYLILDSRMFDRKPQSLEKELNDLGSESWELVATCGVHNQTFVLMRTIASPKKTKSKAEAP